MKLARPIDRVQISCRGRLALIGRRQHIEYEPESVEAQKERGAMLCPVCNERRAAPQYYRVNEATEQVEHLCRACWILLRRSERDDWRYFRGAARLMLVYTVLPVGVAALIVWLLASWVL